MIAHRLVLGTDPLVAHPARAPAPRHLGAPFDRFMQVIEPEVAPDLPKPDGVAQGALPFGLPDNRPLPTPPAQGPANADAGLLALGESATDDVMPVTPGMAVPATGDVPPGTQSAVPFLQAPGALPDFPVAPHGLTPERPGRGAAAVALPRDNPFLSPGAADSGPVAQAGGATDSAVESAGPPSSLPPKGTEPVAVAAHGPEQGAPGATPNGEHRAVAASAPQAAPQSRQPDTRTSARFVLGGGGAATPSLPSPFVAPDAAAVAVEGQDTPASAAGFAALPATDEGTGPRVWKAARATEGVAQSAAGTTGLDAQDTLPFDAAAGLPRDGVANLPSSSAADPAETASELPSAVLSLAVPLVAVGMQAIVKAPPSAPLPNGMPPFWGLHAIGLPGQWGPSISVQSDPAARDGDPFPGADLLVTPLALPPDSRETAPSLAALPAPAPAQTLATSGTAPAPPQGGSGLPPRIAPELAAIVAARPDGPTEVILAPEELGRVSLTLHVEGDAMRIVVLAERGDTLDLLRRHGDVLLEEFRAAGFAGSTLSFGGWGGTGDPPASEDRVLAGPGTTEPPQLRFPPPPPAPDRAGLNLRL